MDLISNSAIYVIFVAFVCDNGKLLGATQKIDIKTCDGSTKAGPVILVKYNEIKSHCECKINPHFIGVLRFASNQINIACYTEINIFENDKPDEVLRLPCGQRTSGGFSVTSDSVLFMTSRYVNSTNGAFTQEATIFEGKTFNGTISVTCGGTFSTSKTTTLRTRTTDGNKLNVTGMANVSSETSTDDIQNKDTINQGSSTKCAPINYMIPGASGVAIGVLLTVIVICHLRQRKSAPRTTGLKDDTHSGQQNNGAYDELQDNPPYQSYQPVDNETHLYDPLQQI